MVKGAKIPISDVMVLKNFNMPKNQEQGNLVKETDEEIQKLLDMKVLEKSEHEAGEVISPIFMVKKSDGSYRMILNLKQFNEAVEYQTVQ